MNAEAVLVQILRRAVVTSRTESEVMILDTSQLRNIVRRISFMSLCNEHAASLKDYCHR